ncbi:unnamed protein product [Ectocarpus fasciculatus]
MHTHCCCMMCSTLTLIILNMLVFPRFESELEVPMPHPASTRAHLNLLDDTVTATEPPADSYLTLPQRASSAWRVPTLGQTGSAVELESCAEGALPSSAVVTLSS